MDSPRVKDRPFCPVTVGACHVQTATDRFGLEAKRAILDRERMSMSLAPEGIEWPILNWPPSDSEDSEFDHVPATSIYKLIPSMPTFRNNLTALSQKYNLYFVAYRSRIYVYVPQSVPRQTIPRHPDAQIGTWPSRIGSMIGGGHIDYDAPHTINHLAVGLLGQEEVVATCHDDGDVTALYTKDIAEYIVSKSSAPSAAAAASRRRKPPTPFFQENVGKPAWGIAIHQQSRLIAVSSNRSEITVFAPALAAREEPQAQNCDCDSCCHDVEERVRRRARNWRIVLSLGSLASNLPNISFLDDKHGNADKISAVDIKGAMWLAEIWKPNQAAIRVMPSTSPLLKSEESWHASSRGWGILALENKYFLTVGSEEELLGAPLRELEIVPKLQAGPHPMVNIARYVRDLPDNPCTQPVVSFPAARLNVANNAVPAAADAADDEAMADEAGDHGSESEATGQSDAAGDDDHEDGGHGDEGDGGDVELDQGSEIDESINVEDDDDETGEDGDGDEEEYDDETEQEDDGGGDDDSTDMFYSTNAGGGVAPESDMPPELGDEQTEESTATPVVEPPAPATVVGLEFQPTGNADMPSEGSLLPVSSSQTAMILQGLFHDLFNPLEDSQSSCTSSSTSSHNNADDVHAAFSHCLKKTPAQHAPAHADMAYMPHSGEVCVIPRRVRDLLEFLRRPVVHNQNVRGYVSGVGKFAERYHMLRMYEKDFEMRTLDKADQKGLLEYGVLCPHALTMGLSPGRASRPHFLGTSRLSMAVHIPELFLVVIGSPIGRVMLVTPTRLAHAVEKGPGMLHYGLRLEWVLPRQSDEALFRANKRPMHGMAVGPVQEGGVLGRGGGEEAAARPRRYRLMLHYRNHDILTYEVSREEESGKVCIF